MFDLKILNDAFCIDLSLEIRDSFAFLGQFCELRVLNNFTKVEVVVVISHELKLASILVDYHVTKDGIRLEDAHLRTLFKVITGIKVCRSKGSSAELEIAPNL